MTLTPETPLRCAEHPAVETYLRCGRCETPICPRCLIYTPVGTRCRACARLRKLPTYDVRAGTYLVASLTGLALAGGFGLLWALLVLLGLGAGFFSLWIVLFLGYGIGELIARAVNRKRGPGLMAIAGGSVALAFLLSRLVPLFLIAGPALVTGSPAAMRLLSQALLDPIAWLIVAIGAVLAASRLR
ncbi:MAG: hypothetical protein RMM58_03380 [Chloroflexota bacterium]|nr:hypothetical protein [Dehalococcoidia bacterium]MDW8252901.1 hypothetical protein [Chloroflexota bacterium]